MSAGGFLARWSKRKLAQAIEAQGREPAAPAAVTDATAVPLVVHARASIAAEATVPATAATDADADSALPAVEGLSLASDFTAFLKEEVSESLRRQALAKLFADPHFNRMDGLDIYIDDYSVPTPIPPEMMAKLQHAREWLGERAADGEERETPAGTTEEDGRGGGDETRATRTAPQLPAEPPATDGEAASTSALAHVKPQAAS